jgi:hypothetical protein
MSTMRKSGKEKIRDLSSDYNDLVAAMVKNGKDVFELEYSNSERAAVRAKSRIREFRKSVDNFYDRLEGVRKDIVGT